MTTLLPLATYAASGTGASTATGVYRALRGSLSVTAFSGSAATFSLETSADGIAWRTVGAWDPVTEEGESARVFGGLSTYVRVAYTVPGSAEVEISGELIQVLATVGDFGDLGLQTGAFEGIPRSKILSVLATASATVLGYLRGRTLFPLVAWGDALRRATVIVATWDLLSSIGTSPEGEIDLYERRYESIIRWLADIASGELPLPDGIEDSSPNVSEGAPDVFSDCPRGW